MRAYLRIPLIILAVVAALATLFTATLIGVYYYVLPDVPDAAELHDVKITQQLEVYTRDGRLIGTWGDERRPVDYEDIPQRVIDAFLATEDERFFEHVGIDYRGIARAILAQLRGGDTVGGSTITQQLPRLLGLTEQSSRIDSKIGAVVNKFREWIFALRIEREFAATYPDPRRAKEEILELFLNTNFFSHGSHGIVTAARRYFGKTLDELTISEVAILAGIPKGPSIYNPISNPGNARERRSYVLRRMLETSKITDAEYASAMAEPVVSRRHEREAQVYAPYVHEMVRIEAERRFGVENYQTAGYRVTTTIDSRHQAPSRAGVTRGLREYDERHGYRGPVARVDLTGLADLPPAEGTARLEAILADHPSPHPDYRAAVVLAADDTSARVYFRELGEQVVGFAAMAWAAPYVDDSRVGNAPTLATDVLAAGDVVLFLPTDAGGFRLAQIPRPEGALVAIDPRDGAIVALTGGFNFDASKFNRAMQARRQPGSTMKPFIYAAALANGYTLATIVNDSPVTIYDPALEAYWTPDNFGDYGGFMPFRKALVDSRNNAAVRIAYDLTNVKNVSVWGYARRFGFDDRAAPANLSIALGAGEVTPVQLAAAYATFANGGYKVEPYFIERIEDADGNVLFEAEPAFACGDCAEPRPGETGAVVSAPLPGTTIGGGATASGVEPAAMTLELPPMVGQRNPAPQAITPQNAYLTTSILADVVRVGTGTRARTALGRSDMAGKTGTTNDMRDTWFAGFSNDVVAIAWVGFDDDRPLGGNEQGGRTAIPVWIDYMRAALEGVPEQSWRRPLGIVERRVNPDTGLIASPLNGNAKVEAFEYGTEPEREPDPFVAPGIDPGGAPVQDSLPPATTTTRDIF